jgi:hypothetical protein
MAVLSMAVSNLYHFYAERIPNITNAYTDTTGKQGYLVPNNSGAGNTYVSSLEVEHQVATSRARSTVWHDSMEHQPPVILQREQLFIEADQLYETHQLRLEIERMNATMSVMLIQQQKLTQGLSKATSPSAGAPPASGSGSANGNAE